jgi:hypothetical protein
MVSMFLERSYKDTSLPGCQGDLVDLGIFLVLRVKISADLQMDPIT